MKIVICGSMSASKEMIKAKQYFEKKGHSVVLPKNAEEYALGKFEYENRHESLKNKLKHDLIRGYFKKIEVSDVVLIVNIDKDSINNYIGGNSFIELAFGHVLNKDIYLLNPIPDVSYADEIKAMKPVVINNDLSKIK